MYNVIQSGGLEMSMMEDQLGFRTVPRAVCGGWWLVARCMVQNAWARIILGGSWFKVLRYHITLFAMWRLDLGHLFGYVPKSSVLDQVV